MVVSELVKYPLDFDFHILTQKGAVKSYNISIADVVTAL